MIHVDPTVSNVEDSFTIASSLSFNDIFNEDDLVNTIVEIKENYPISNRTVSENGDDTIKPLSKIVNDIIIIKE